MKMLSKPLVAVGLAAAALASPVAIAPAAAQQVAGIGVLNMPGVIAATNAYRAAAAERPTAYKTEIDALNARRNAISADLQARYAKLDADSKLPNAAQNRAALQAQFDEIQAIEQNGQAELQQLSQPLQFSQAYVEEQISDKLGQAIETVAKRKNVTLVLTPQSVIYAEAPYDMSRDVLAELNTLVPSAQVTPPAGWLPAELREQQAQAAAAAAPAATTPAAPVQGR